MCHHILIIDDDDRIRELLQKYLIKNNFRAMVATNTAEAKKTMLKNSFDLLIVDYMMPDENGIEFINFLRKDKNMIPVIMLTALGEIENKLEGLGCGADDYITKPFEPKELLLRINNILKRTNKIDINNNFYFGDFKFDFNKNELYKNEVQIKLTDMEIKILSVFLKNSNKTLSREELYGLLNNIMNERSIDVQITRLRKKIEPDPKNPQFLKTVRNKGYLFVV